MSHLPDLILDLVLILVSAAVITLIFRRIKQPLVLGYILAGFLVSPYIEFLPTVRETKNIQIWAEIGVVFLLFGLGLEFSFKKLLKVGAPASITAVTEVVLMAAIGYVTGWAMGWSFMDSIFLGGILAISSTTIIIRAFEELGMKTQRFTALVFGVLIVEDLVAIVLMVLLSTLAVSQHFQGTEMLMSILKLIFFLSIWFFAGIFLIPTLLKRIKKLLTDEMLLITSIALCLLMVVFADLVGFSPALGAFIMGSILAETTKAEKIEHLVKPVKDLFGAIFFVSVGMMIDPSIIIDYAVPVVILCVVTIVGKIFSTTLGALLSGQTLQTSVQSGFSLAQIGEFSFIIATLGLTLKVTSGFLYPIAIAVSAVTTLTTPYLIKSSGVFYHWLSRKIPKRWLDRINAFSTESRTVNASSDWQKYFRAAMLNVVLFSGLIVCIILISVNYVMPLADTFDNGGILSILIGLATMVLILPFLWALAVRNPPRTYALVVNRPQYAGAIRLLRLFRLVLAAAIIGFLMHQFMSSVIGLIVTSVIILLTIVLSERIQGFYNRIERRFVENLNQRELEHQARTRQELAPWDARIASIRIEPDSYCVGKSLFQLRWREVAGVNIVLIKRGEHQILVPGKDEIIFPGDELLVLGTDIQLKKVEALIRHHNPDLVEDEGPKDVGLYEFAVYPDSPIAGTTIRKAGIRDIHHGLVVGIGRDGKRILNPDSDFTILAGDVVFIVGQKNEIVDLFTPSAETVS